MKVRVSMPEASVAVDFKEEKALDVFGKLNEVLLAMKKKSKVPAPEESGIHAKTVIRPKIKILPKPEINALSIPVEKSKELSTATAPKYKGFMYIKCPVCGKEKGLCMKKESDHYHCDSCGKRSEFEKLLIPLQVSCECGKKYKYLTNMTESMFDINCLDCGAPVAVKWNENKQVYETIK